jgi:hypothetical protein
MRSLLFSFIIFLSLSLAPSKISASNTELDFDEVFIEFRYLQIINTTVVGYYANDRFYLPIEELFSMLLVFGVTDWDKSTFSGYITSTSNSYLIDFEHLIFQFRDISGTLNVEDYILDQFGYYLSIDLFNRIFGMDFQLDESSFTMRLFTELRLPVRLRDERHRARSRVQQTTGLIEPYQLLAPRDTRIFSGGFLDYNINLNSINFERNTFLAGFNTGVEFLAGDLQSNFSINQSQDGQLLFNPGSFRWRYYNRNSNGFLRQVMVGDIQNRGITFNQPIRGISINNEPLFSSRIFDEYNYVNSAQPDSEVEIFINNRLFEYLYVDQSGIYQLRIPITYGINDIRIVTYSPDGRITEVTERLNIPFYFVPARKLYYNSYLARTRTNFFSPDEYTVGLIDIGYGIGRSSTIKFKSEFVAGPETTENSALLEYNQRFTTGVLGTFQYAPNRFESANLSFQSSSNSFLNAYVTNYRQRFQEVNNDIRFRTGGNVFFGFSEFHIPTFIRMNVDYNDFGEVTSRSLSNNLIFRLGRLSTTFGFRNQYRKSATFNSNQNNFNANISYSTPRSPAIWTPLRGISLRGQVTSSGTIDNVNNYNISLSRSFWMNGQMQINYSYFTATKAGSIFFTLTFELSNARFNSSARRTSNSYVINQSMRGSVGYFHPARILHFDNRNLVGRSGLIINNFIDTDGDGIFSESDQTLPYAGAMRVQGAGARSTSRKGMSIVSQLRQYDRVNIEVNEGMIQDPSLVAVNRKFSVITDPNRFKYIEVPFSRTGIVEGFVTRDINGSQEPLGGLTIRFISLYGNEDYSARTFFDGSFYKMEMIPGRYVAYPDSTQLQILGVRAEPAIYPFEIVASEFGDFVDIAFELYPLVPVEPSPDVAPEPAPPVVAPPVAVADPENVIAPPVAVADPEPVAPPVTGLEPSQLYRVQIAMMPTLARAMIARERVERLLNHPAEITLSNRLNMYRVLTRDIDDLQTATQMLAIVSRETEHRDAYMLNSVNYLLSDVTYAVQIGAFRNSAAADRHAEQARSRFGLDVHSFYHEISGWFVVQTREFTNWREAILLRDRIRSTTTYTDAFTSAKPPEFQIFSSYSVQVGAYAREEFARTQAQAFSRRTGMRFVVEYNPAARLYAVRVVDLNDLQQAETILRRLLEDYGFEEGIILSLERASGMN